MYIICLNEILSRRRGKKLFYSELVASRTFSTCKKYCHTLTIYSLTYHICIRFTKSFEKSLIPPIEHMESLRAFHADMRNNPTCQCKSEFN